ncbi:helix-turn-helix domain-containing protein [Microbacterium sp. che218]|uniref:helix-turn-helix domain-containing protein n=1 Tax=Microbacterium sp. che218 TaxID=3140649 RepID=UPI0033676D53
MTSIQDAALVVRARELAASGEAKRIRVASDLPIGDLAHAIGVDATTIWRWENGERSPRGERAVRYARALNKLTKVRG